MNLYTLLLLCATAISILLGYSVYSLNRKASTNRLFMGIMMFNAYWAICYFMMSLSSNATDAAFWGKVLAFWPFLDALILHFALAFTESEVLKNKLTYVVLYFPALLFSITDLTTTQIFTYDPILQSWGFQNTIQVDSIIARIYGVWSGIYTLLALFCLVNFHNKTVDKLKKRQTAVIAVGFFIPIVVSLFTDSIFPVMGLDVPVMGPIFASVSSIFVVYAMIKLELFKFTPEIAAENVFSTMPDAVILVNLKGVITKVNRSLVELTGYSENEIVGQQVNVLLQQAKVSNGEGSTPKIFALLPTVRELRNYEIEFNVKSGERLIGVVSCSVITDGNGHDVGSAFVLHDITARKKMEQKLLRSERLASIGELATILGHDLRNPLSGIRGATFFLRRKHSNVWDREDLTMFESIDKSIDYSNKIINDLLDYSAEIRLDLASVTPRLLLKEALMLSHVPEDIFVVDETSDKLSFCVDTVKICRAFVNVIKNAVDAMPEGGRLIMKSEVVGEFVSFTFRDSGVGMSSETLKRISSPLFTTKAKGMGFGLAICRRFVEAHGGGVSIESTEGEGTTVRVNLPLFLGTKTQK